MSEAPAGARPPRERLGALLALLVLCALGVAAFANGLDAPFVHDDEPAITDNPRIRSIVPPRDANYAVQSTERGRPLVRLSLALNYALGGLEPRGYHAFNLAVHVLSAWLLFLLARRTLRLPGVAPQPVAAAAPLLALALAALWLVHPLQVDAVTYTIQRTELLMGLFLLLTLYCASRALDAQRARRFELASVAACALGMLSKEAMVAAPLLVALHDRAFAFPSWRAALARRRGLWLGLAATWIILAFLVAGGPRDQTVGLDLGVPWWRYLATQAGMILHYLRLVFWPDPLCLDYGRELAGSLGEVAPGAIVVGGLFLATLWALRARPALGFLGAFFYLVLGPSSSVVPIVTEVGAERRMHLPLAAVLAALLLGAHALARRLAPRRATALVAGASCALVAVLSAVTVRRNEVFRSALALWEDTVATRPRNPAARNNLGRELARAGRLEEAAREFALALELPHCPPDALVNLGNVLTDLGRLDEAASHFEELLRLDPDRPGAHEGLAGVRMRQERWAEAIAHYETCLAAGHRSADLHSNLGKALYKAGRVDEAIAQMKEALALDPGHEIAAANLAIVLGRP